MYVAKLCIKPPPSPEAESDYEDMDGFRWSPDTRQHIILPNLGKFPELRRLQIQSFILSDISLAGLQGATKLEVLDICACKLSASAFESLQDVPSLITLKVAMHHSTREASNQCFRAIGKLRNVTVLGLDYVQPYLEDSGILALSGMTQLEVLDISGYDVRLSDVGAQTLGSFCKLKVLYMRDWGFLSSQTGFSVLSCLPLTALDLANDEGVFGFADDEFLGKLRGLPLTSLNLDHCEKITDQGIECLAGMPLEILSLLALTQITDESLNILKFMPLTCLGLGGCATITNVGLGNLSQLPLTTLDLGGRDLVSEGLGLALLDQVTTLQKLVVGYYGRVSEEISSRVQVIDRYSGTHFRMYTSPIAALS